MTVHWVYPTGPQIKTPEAIGRNVAARLRARGWEVVQHGWDDLGRIEPRPGDVLVGHPHYAGGTVFRESARRPGWRRVIAVAPYAHGLPEQVAWFDRVLPVCDLFLAITGPYWFRRVERSPFAHWRPKMVHLDLAIDPADFPRVKRSFHPPGRRKLLYVGDAGWQKNIPYLSAIARRIAPIEVAWAGGKVGIDGVRPLGFLDFATDAARAVVAEHDFLVTVGRSDANPTTLLEAASWGLVPVCTPQSGYEDEPGFVNVPLDDVEAAARVLRELQACPPERLEALRAENDARLAAHFTWDRFTRQIVEAIESEARPALGHAAATRRLKLRLIALTSPRSPLRWRNIKDARRRRRAWRKRRAAASKP